VNVTDVVAAAAMLAGGTLFVIAGIGLQRFDDVFARMHAATKSVTLGLSLVCIGAALQVDAPGDKAKLLLVAALQFITAPVGAHMLGRAAYRSGTELSPDTAIDELADPPDPPTP
jgi:multicomponent Na+:H+ antiporter subunit G